MSKLRELKVLILDLLAQIDDLKGEKKEAEETQLTIATLNPVLPEGSGSYVSTSNLRFQPRFTGNGSSGTEIDLYSQSAATGDLLTWGGLYWRPSSYVAVGIATQNVTSGSVGAPSIYFGGNSTTGWYSPSANVLGWTVSGVAKMLVSSTTDTLSANVVMGVDSSSTLVVNSATSSTVGATGAATALPANPLGYLAFTMNGTSVKIPYYESAGNVFTGTLGSFTAATSSPATFDQHVSVNGNGSREGIVIETNFASPSYTFYTASRSGTAWDDSSRVLVSTPGNVYTSCQSSDNTWYVLYLAGNTVRFVNSSTGNSDVAHLDSPLTVTAVKLFWDRYTDKVYLSYESGAAFVQDLWQYEYSGSWSAAALFALDADLLSPECYSKFAFVSKGTANVFLALRRASTATDYTTKIALTKTSGSAILPICAAATNYGDMIISIWSTATIYATALCYKWNGLGYDELTLVDDQVLANHGFVSINFAQDHIIAAAENSPYFAVLCLGGDFNAKLKVFKITSGSDGTVDASHTTTDSCFATVVYTYTFSQAYTKGSLTLHYSTQYGLDVVGAVRTASTSFRFSVVAAAP